MVRELSHKIEIYTNATPIATIHPLEKVNNNHSCILKSDQINILTNLQRLNYILKIYDFVLDKRYRNQIIGPVKTKT